MFVTRFQGGKIIHVKNEDGLKKVVAMSQHGSTLTRRNQSKWPGPPAAAAPDPGADERPTEAERPASLTQGPEQGPSADSGGPTSQEATVDGASAAETTAADMTDSVQSEILIPGALTSTPMQPPQVQSNEIIPSDINPFEKLATDSDAEYF